MSKQNSKKNPLVEVIILTHNAKNHLINCLKSLKNNNYNNFIISVVDQNSNDGSADFVKKNYPEINLEINKINNGFVGGNNQILKKSKAKYCILLNDDTIQDPSWISELVKIAEKDENIAALQPKVLSLRDKRYLEYAGAAGGFIDIYGYPLCRGRVFYNLEHDRGQYNDLKKVFWCSGVAIFLRRKVLDKIGYLDDSFFIYSEELDLCWRMNLAGYKQFYVPSSKIYHVGSSTMSRKEYKFNKVYLLHRNTLITMLKNYSFKKWFIIFPVKIGLEIAAILAFLPKEPLRSLAILKANLWVLFHPIYIIKRHNSIQKLRKVEDSEIMNNMVDRSIVFQYFIKKNKKFNGYIKFIKNY